MGARARTRVSGARQAGCEVAASSSGNPIWVGAGGAGTRAARAGPAVRRCSGWRWGRSRVRTGVGAGGDELEHARTVDGVQNREELCTTHAARDTDKHTRDTRRLITAQRGLRALAPQLCRCVVCLLELRAAKGARERTREVVEALQTRPVHRLARRVVNRSAPLLRASVGHAGSGDHPSAHRTWCERVSGAWVPSQSPQRRECMWRRAFGQALVAHGRIRAATRASWEGHASQTRPYLAKVQEVPVSAAQHSMDGPRRSGRKRTQTQFEAATETVAKDAGRTRAVQGIARRARAAAIAAAYEPLGGLVQLGEAGGGERLGGRVALAQWPGPLGCGLAQL
jgi:hypothetical protein